MIIRNNITEVAYNIQSTVDAKHNIPIDFKTTNNNDSKAMGIMLRRAKSILKTNQFAALYDKGYHTGSEFDIANKLGIETLVAVPAISRASQAPDMAYNVEHFTYDQQNDVYICPEKQTLQSNGTWYKAKNYKFRQFKTKACSTCKVRKKCTASKRNGKIVQRSQYTEAIEQNKKRVAQNKELYRKRQTIVEHPFGTIKRNWGFDHIMTKKGIQRAESDVGLIFISYNLRRLINLISLSKLLVYCKAIISLYFQKYRPITLKISISKPILVFQKKSIIFTQNSLKNLFLQK